MKVKIEPTKYLEGTIKISGSKNSCLPILAISLLTNKRMLLSNVPMISDIYDMLEILKKLGVQVKISKDKKRISLKRKKVKNELLIEEVEKIRASYYVIPGMINKNNSIKIKYPGGCSFSKRPIDYHLNALKNAGASVIEKENIIEVRKKKIKNSVYSFPNPSVGATINSIMLSIITKGTSKIINQPIEPEIKDFINCLKKMGAKIYIDNKDIIVKGGKKLKSVSYNIMPDRIELGSYILLASSIKSKVKLTNINSESIDYLLPYLDKLNINYKLNKTNIDIYGNSSVKNINLIISHYPNFPTDLQQILCALLFKANENSQIKDEIYPKRITHVSELKKMGGNIKFQNDCIYITPTILEGSSLFAHDLRCGFSLILASVNATSYSIIDNFQVVNRGYEDIINKLNSINVNIKILKK